MAIAAIALSLGCGRSPNHPNVVLVVVDTLRRDALHLYGNPEPDSDNLEALAARGWTFDNHITHASQTVPATLTMLLSQLPAEHGFVFHNITDFADHLPVYPDSMRFLAEVLHDAGYATAGFTGNPYLTRRNHFDQGFDRFASSSSAHGERLTKFATTWLRQWARDGRERPFFLYLHYMDAHQPYDPPEPWRSRFAGRDAHGHLFSGNGQAPGATPTDRAYNWALYTASVAYVDDQIGRLLATLDDLGVRGHTVIAVTADHGEEFLEHGGIGHGTSLYGELVRVPLVLVAPGRLTPGPRIGHLSKHLDLAPTLLALADVPSPPSFRGRSLLRPTPRVLLDTGSWRGVYSNGWDLLRSRVLSRELLFSWDDELDTHPVQAEAAKDRLETQLADYRHLEQETSGTRVVRGTAPDWSAAERERLRALGYAN